MKCNEINVLKPYFKMAIRNFFLFIYLQIGVYVRWSRLDIG